MEHYNIHVFTDGTIIFIENGTPHRDSRGNYRVREIEGQRGKAGFGPSPNSPTPHVIVEFEIKLSSSGSLASGAYSPEPQFWSSSPAPCSLSDLTPVTDPLAQDYENSPNNPPLHLDHVNDTLEANINAFIADVQTQLGVSLHMTSAFRPTSYQSHLYEISQKKKSIVTMPADKQAECQDLLNDVNAEIAKHGLNVNAAGIPTVNPPGTSAHETGNAIDLGPKASIVGLSGAQLTQFNQIAADNHLGRPHKTDPVHFESTGTQLLAISPTSVGLDVFAVGGINLLATTDTGGALASIRSLDSQSMSGQRRSVLFRPQRRPSEPRHLVCQSRAVHHRWYWNDCSVIQPVHQHARG